MTQEPQQLSFSDHPTLRVLDEEQKQKFLDFREGLYKKAVEEKELFPASDWPKWRESDLDDMCLYRFLYGYGWNVECCINVAIDMIEWIQQVKPKEIKLKDLEIARTGHLFHYGHDLKDRPVLYLISAKDTLENTEENVKEKFKHIVHTVEQCIADIKNPQEVYRITWVVELANSSISMSMVQTLKGHFDVLGARYPERCAQILVLNPPWYASWAWSFIKPFLTPEMQERYIFIRGYANQVREQLLTYIGEDQLPPELYNGKAKFKFDYDKMKQSEA